MSTPFVDGEILYAEELNQMNAEIEARVKRSTTPNVLHGTSATGSDVTRPVVTAATGGAVVQRGTSGQVTVRSTPSEASEATSKAYVDGQDAERVPTVTTPNVAYATDGSGVDTPIPVVTAATGNAIPRRGGLGQVTVRATPTFADEAASKGYVDAADTANTTANTTLRTDMNTNLNTKRDKITSGGNSVYAFTGGADNSVSYSTAATVNHLAQRTTSGNIIVPATPGAGTHATSKSYVDTAVATATPGDTGWVALTLLSGWTSVSPWAAPAYRVINNVCYIRGRVTGPSGTATPIFNLPAGARPSGSLGGDVTVSTLDAGGPVRLGVWADAPANAGVFIGMVAVVAPAGTITGLSLSAIVPFPVN